LFEAHDGRMLVAIKNSSPLTSILSVWRGEEEDSTKRYLLPLLAKRGEGE
jgi:hypothetical protein